VLRETNAALRCFGCRGLTPRSPGSIPGHGKNNHYYAYCGRADPKLPVSGVVEGSFGIFSATGQSFTIRGISTGSLRDCLIAHNRDYWNLRVTMVASSRANRELSAKTEVPA
jgi:hypothetical protein